MTRPPDASPALDAVVRALRDAGCVFAEDEAGLLVQAAPDGAVLDSLVAQRATGVPLEHLLGWVAFAGSRWAVAPGVFVPRRRTELLVHLAATLTRPGEVVVDLCCGSGAVGAALATAAGAIELHAADVDPVALACATRNVALVGGTVHRGDLYDALPSTLRGRVDIIVANAPYVPSEAIALMPPEARDHEPRHTLDGGPDGLDLARRIASAAPAWLGPGGRLLIETSERQAPVLAEVFAHSGLEPEVVHDAELEATAVVGQRM